MKHKSHQLVNGKLLNQNKTYADLKVTQKEKIAAWFYAAAEEYVKIHGPSLNKDADTYILQYVYDKIEAAEIWIPHNCVKQRYRAKKNRIVKHIQKTFCL